MNPLPTKPNRWRPITVLNLLAGLLFSLSALAQPAFIKEGLVAYYPFNGNANDESGNAHNLLPKGVVFPANDRFGNVSKAFSFNGNSHQQPGMLKGSDLHLPISSSQRTVTAWFKAKSIGDADVIFHWGGLKTESAFYGIIGLNSERKILFGQAGGGDNPSWGPIEINRWYCSTFSYGPDGIARIYLNGSLVASGKRSFKTTTDSEGFEIGGYQGNPWFYGDIDDVRIYNRALSDGEVKALYDYESTPPDNSFITNGLVAYYPFSGNANDESGNQHHLTPTNPPLYGEDRFGSRSYSAEFPIGSKLPPNDSNVFKGEDAKLPLRNSPRTVTVWFNAYSISPAFGTDVMFHWGGYNSESAFYGWVGRGNAIALGKAGGGNNYPEWRGISPLKWYSAAFVLESNGNSKIFINGELKGVELRVFNTTVDSMNLTIGGYNGRSSFDGRLDDIRIYNRALSDTEVKALYEYESTPQPLNPRTATATAQVVNGFVVGATIKDGGYGYVSNPVVTITGGGGTGAKATALQVDGVVTSITITNPGSGYTSTPYITIAPPPFPPRKATSTAQIINGFVVGTKITDGGFSYDSPPAVLIIGGGGSGATAVATVANGVVTAITITNPGTGYTSVPIVRIASPPFAPKLGIETSKVFVRMSVVLGRKYQLEASTDLNSWTTTGPAFIAQDEELVQEFDVNQVGRYFRINQVP